jgi:hypothetical protein
VDAEDVGASHPCGKRAAYAAGKPFWDFSAGEFADKAFAGKAYKDGKAQGADSRQALEQGKVVFFELSEAYAGVEDDGFC